MDIKEKDYIIRLYDIYGELLTIKQQEYFELYMFEDNSLLEISIELKISRNAVHDSIKKSKELLFEYETKLKILDKTNKKLEIYNSNLCNEEKLLKIKELDEM